LIVEITNPAYAGFLFFLESEMSIESQFSRDMETRFFLPSALIEALEEERTNAQEQEEVKDVATSPLGGLMRKKNSREREIDELLSMPVLDPTQGMPNRLRLMDVERARRAIAEAMAGTVSDEARDRFSIVMKRLANAGAYRVLSKVPNDWKNRLDRLSKDFPNFREPLSYLRAMLAFSQARDGTIYFEPMLFNGPAGIGKTYFCRTLSKVLGNEFRLLQMEQQQESSSLTGSSKFWSNSSPGFIFESLFYGTEANFLCMIDEVDKASSGEFDPLAGLYGLMERNTAKEFVDQSIPWVQMDASRILWVLTSNVLTDIPAPIRSRLRVFSIEAPTPAEMREIVRRIYQEICTEQLGRRRMKPLRESVIDRLLALPPRRIRPALQEGIGQALFENRRELLPADIKESIEKRRSIGFTNS
jgi:ATP-dependent Lon protease